MKKVFNSLFVIIAAMVTFAGCAKQEIDAPATPETKTVQFFANSIETKTAFGAPEGKTYPTLWSDGDEVRLFLNLDVKADTDKKAEVECSNDHKSARFEATFADPGLENPDYTYTFYAISPESAYVNSSKSAKEGRITVTIPETQHPLPTTVDPLAQILYAASTTTDDMPPSVDFKFHHLTAYGRFTLLNLANDDSPVSMVKIEAPEEVYLSGKWNYFVNGDTTIGVKEGINTLTINTTNTTDIWFACAPADVAGKTFKFTVTTEAGNFVRNVTFPSSAKFESGKIAKFTVDMTGITAGGTDEPEQPGETTEAWTLVTDASTLAVGDNVIIAAKDYDYAISTTQNKNNRGQANIDKSDNTLVSPSDDVQILTLTEGTVDGTFGFYTGSEYLYAASSSSNYLKSQTTNNDNGSWSVTIAADGTATVVSQGSYTRNTMQYNQQSSLFACYASASQKAIVIYKLVSTGGEGGGETPDPEEPQAPVLSVKTTEINLEATDVNGEISYSLANPVDGISVSATTEAAWITDFDCTIAEKVTFKVEENTGDAREAVITISYKGADPKNVSVKQKAPVKKMTVAEVLEVADDSDVEVEGLVIAKYEKGLLLGDATGVVLVYNGSSLNAGIGDMVSVSGTKDIYNNWAQIANPTVEVVSSDNQVTHPNIIELDGSGMDNLLSAQSVSYIQYTGTLTVSGTYYNVAVEGASTAIGSIQYPAASLGLADMSGKKIKVTGYHVGISSGKYVNTMATSVEVVEGGTTEPEPTPDPEPEPDPTPDPEPDQPVENAWKLVTDASTLKAGDQIVIVAKNANYAMSTTQNSNNRAQAAVTKSGNTITVGSDVQVLTLEVGNTSGTFAFNTGSGYLYAASSSKNYLKTEKTLSANSSWNITITNDGVATIKATGSNTRNWIRYNSSNNPPLFSCYGSGQADVCIYKFQ